MFKKSFVYLWALGKKEQNSSNFFFLGIRSTFKIVKIHSFSIETIFPYHFPLLVQLISLSLLSDRFNLRN
ncbi:hypothetical protein BLOT_007591 [Blomia tropicalis]|nr:hypothetical protein BLOT_007591 [Blomia tropicalis]